MNREKGIIYIKKYVISAFHQQPAGRASGNYWYHDIMCAIIGRSFSQYNIEIFAAIDGQVYIYSCTIHPRWIICIGHIPADSYSSTHFPGHRLRCYPEWPRISGNKQLDIGVTETTGIKIIIPGQQPHIYLPFGERQFFNQVVVPWTKGCVILIFK